MRQRILGLGGGRLRRRFLLGSGASVGSSTFNTLTTDDVLTSQTPLRCTIAYEDP
jgi:hypothetical protein